MRGCTCTGLTLCDQCSALAEMAGIRPPPPVPVVSERALQTAVLRLARASGYLAYFTYRSTRSPEGFPDLVCVHPTERERPVLAWELKTATGEVTLAQAAWVEALDGRQVVSAIYRPEDWPQIVEALRR